jgi:hypothetical protein
MILLKANSYMTETLYYDIIKNTAATSLKPLKNDTTKKTAAACM